MPVSFEVPACSRRATNVPLRRRDSTSASRMAQPRQPLRHVPARRAHLHRSELTLVVADRAAVCDAWWGSTPIVTCMEPPWSHLMGTAEGTPTYNSSCTFLFRATPRRDPERMLFVRKPDPRTASRQTLRERPRQDLETLRTNRNANRSLKYARWGWPYEIAARVVPQAVGRVSRAAGGSGAGAYDSSAQRLVAWYAPSVPWPHAVDLDLEREAQDDSDQHDGPEDDDALDGLVDHDRADDVGDDEHFEAEQDHAAEVLAQVTEGVLTASARRSRGRSERTRRVPRRSGSSPRQLRRRRRRGRRTRGRSQRVSSTRLPDLASLRGWVVRGGGRR